MTRPILPELHQLLFEDLLRHALLEDLGRAGDVTTDAVVEHDRQASARIIAREPCRVSGGPVAAMAFHLLDANATVRHPKADCDDAEAGDVLLEVRGRARSLLSAERTAINLLARLCGIATLTRAYVDAIAGTPAAIYDTRKTTPGLRALEKYAVRCGGGDNHRAGLYDAILIKENHVKSAGGISEALRRAQGAAADVLVEVEVESLAELREALDAGAARILLDNFTLADLREAVAINAGYGYVGAELEASSNVSLETIRDIAETGVDYISTGAITKNVRAIDLSMQFRID